MPRTALMTGGASGLGSASAARLRAEGLTVTTLDVSGPADRSAGALVMSISSGAATTGTPLTISKGNPPSPIGSPPVAAGTARLGWGQVPADWLPSPGPSCGSWPGTGWPDARYVQFQQ